VAVQIAERRLHPVDDDDVRRRLDHAEFLDQGVGERLVAASVAARGDDHDPHSGPRNLESLCIASLITS
jgi:hypothetical protein